jgi:prephenate dehydrogenase
MPTSISLLGLNRFSGSLGLALATREGLALTAYANDPDTARIAQSRGMAQRSEWNLINAVSGADVVILAMPLGPGGTLDTLRLIGPELRAGCVVICLASLLNPPLQWAADHLPAERHFIALHPILSPAHLYDGTSGLDAADASLFTDALWALAASTTCAPEALKLASDLGLLVKATPYFVDPAEHDGLMGGANALPGILAWALMRAASGSTGWSEMRKVADREFATATAALMEVDAHALTLNRANVVRYLDTALAELQTLRAEIDQANTVAVAEMLAEADTRRAQWRADRQRGEWDAASRPNVDLPTPGQSIQKLFVGNLLSRKDDKKNKP